MPLQLVACGDREFRRLNRTSLQAFEIARELPAPHIRGSRVARQTTQIDIEEPLNLVPLSERRVLVIAKSGVFRHQLGKTNAERLAPIETKSPLWVWADQGGRTFWVRVLGEQHVRRHELASLASPGDDAANGVQRSPDGVLELPGFDAKLFGVLAGGTVVYSTSEGLRSPGAASPLASPLLPSATSLFGDAFRKRYWTADELGNLALWQSSGETALATSKVPGIVIDMAQEASRVAVLSMELRGNRYQPRVTVFANGREEALVHIGPSVASGGQPVLDLCLIPDLPWLVVGGRHWLQLLDFSGPRLLAEW